MGMYDRLALWRRRPSDPTTSTSSRDLLVVPVHPPKVNYALSLLISLGSTTDPGFDVLFVITHDGERAVFEQIISAVQVPCTVHVVSAQDIITDLVSSGAAVDFMTNARRQVINAKKFAGLMWGLRHGYDVMACVDSETVFTKPPLRLFSNLRDNNSRAEYFSAPALDYRMLIEAPARLLSSSDQDVIERLTGGFEQYCWFFDIPTYPSADFQDFIDYMTVEHGDLETFFCKLRYETFEHMLFVYYLLATRRAVLIDYSKIIGSQREALHLTPEDLGLIRSAHSYAPRWISLMATITSTVTADVDALTHTDRLFDNFR